MRSKEQPPATIFVTLSSKYAYRSHWISVREDLASENGNSPRLYHVVEMKPGVMIGAVTDDDRVFLVGQNRYAVGRYTWEVIGGAVDEGETPLGAAKRELLEESGLIARSWTYLGSAELGTASLDGSMHFFVARVLIQGTPKPETTEKLLIKEFGLGEAIDMACNGSICHLPSIVLLLRLALEGK